MVSDPVRKQALTGGDKTPYTEANRSPRWGRPPSAVETQTECLVRGIERFKKR